MFFGTTYKYICMLGIVNIHHLGISFGDFTDNFGYTIKYILWRWSTKLALKGAAGSLWILKIYLALKIKEKEMDNRVYIFDTTLRDGE